MTGGGSGARTTTVQRIVKSATLDGFMQITDDADGVNLRALEPLTPLVVRTKNSTYEISVTGGTAAIVQGGQFFPTPTAVEVCGASMSGSFIKLGWIGVGFCMELVAGGRSIVTTRVRAIAIRRPSGDSRPH